MSKMNFKDWPVVDMTDFEEVTVDAMRWGDDGYQAIFNFVHAYADDSSDGEGNQGFTLTTHIIADTLREIYQRVTVLIELGLFDGSNVQAHGRLIDENADELAVICWHQYSDSEWSDDMNDSAGLTFDDEDDGIMNFPSPTTLQ